jgi:methylamine utilization protein MauE
VATAAARARESLRVVIGVILLATAAGKLLDVSGFARVLGSYQAFPGWSLTPLACAIPSVELGLALWLFSGLGLRAAAAASLAMHLAYGAWSAVSLLRGLKLSNCGCFGVFLARPLDRVTVVEDGAMAALSAALLLLARKHR